MGSRHLDLTGLSFGKVTVLKLAGIKNGDRAWECKCVCSNRIELTTQQLTKYSKHRDCGCNAAKPLRQKETEDMIALRLLVSGEVLEVIPETLVITDMGNGSVLLTGIDNAQIVSISVAKDTVYKALERFKTETNLKQWTIDSESYNTMRPANVNKTAWRKVKTLITIKRDTHIIHAVAKETN